MWSNVLCDLTLGNGSASLRCLQNCDVDLSSLIPQQLVKEFCLKPSIASRVAERVTEMLGSVLDWEESSQFHITLLNADREFELLFDREYVVDFSNEKTGVDESCEAVQFQVRFHYIECYQLEVDRNDERKFHVPCK